MPKPEKDKQQHEIERKWLEKFATKEEFSDLKREVRHSNEMVSKHFDLLEKTISTSISGEVKHMTFRLLSWMVPFMLAAIGTLCSITYHIILKSH